jgi:hypothetical protein
MHAGKDMSSSPMGSHVYKIDVDGSIEADNRKKRPSVEPDGKFFVLFIAGFEQVK